MNNLKPLQIKNRITVFEALSMLDRLGSYFDGDGNAYKAEDVLALNEEEQEGYFNYGYGDYNSGFLSTMEEDEINFSKLVLTNSLGGIITLEHFTSANGDGPYRDTSKYYEGYSLYEAYMSYFCDVRENFLLLLDQFFNWEDLWHEEENPEEFRFHRELGSKSKLEKGTNNDEVSSGAN